MPPNPHGKATMREKLGAVLKMGLLMTKGFYTFIRYLLVTDPRAQRTLEREMNRTITRTMIDLLNPAQLHWIFPTSTAAYEGWIATRAKKEGAPSEVITELIGDDGAKLHWIGSKDAKKVMLHFHSGGFILPLNHGHLSLFNYFRREIKRRSNIEVKAAFLEYTLSPMSSYPTQYQQAVRALQHIVKSGISSADILISGDSAGGMLAMQIISHHLHPHPSISALPIPQVPFAGILAISPWVVFDSNAPSFVNNDRDCISQEALLLMGRLAWQGNLPPDTKDEPEEYWREPLRAPHDWWKGTEKVTKHVMFTYGEWESLRDDILSLIVKFKEGVAGDKVDIAKAEELMGLHIGPTLDAWQARAPSDVTKAMAEWIHDRLVV